MPPVRAKPSIQPGDQVWVRTGLGLHEEPATVIELLAPIDVDKDKHGDDIEGSKKDVNDNKVELSVKFIVSGHESVVTMDEIRSMDDKNAHEENRDGRGRTLRRSTRSSGGASSLPPPPPPVPVTSLGDNIASATSEGVKRRTRNGSTKKVSRVTPSPTECDSASNTDSVMEIEQDCNDKSERDMVNEAKPAARATRKRKQEPKETKAASNTNKRTKKAAAAKCEENDADNSSNADETAKSSPYFAKEAARKETESPYFAKDAKEAATTKNGKAGAEASAKGGQLEEDNKLDAKKKPVRGRKLILAMSDGEDADNNGSDDEDVGILKAHQKKRAKSPATSATAKKKAGKAKKDTSNDKTNNATTSSKAKTSEKVTKEKKARAKRENNNDNNNSPRPQGGEPDGNGGLNQPQPFHVEYAATGRATCRTCDEKIEKGELRVGHCPLFRGKPGYMVFRHLHCTIFSEHVTCAEDVHNYDILEDEEYEQLVEQVEVSKEKIKEEMEELEPDELVQKSFEGEIRKEPPGLSATLLPFQVEGFSWMRHQEVKEPDIRGGILADEMGMGKTLQTISTILDHRPKLQHSEPGAKHPPTSDLEERQNEEALWDKAAVDWKHEMDMLKVMKKIRSKDGGSRAGTLVICPVIALTQWRTEIEKFTEDGALTVCTYHGPDRETQTPREMMKKYDVVLTTYQVLEADFRKMTSPNRVACPNCGGKFKIDKLPIHLKYFCGEGAQKTEAQARQRRNSDRDNGGGSGRRRGPSSGRNGGDKKKKEFKKKSATDATEKKTNKKKAASRSSSKEAMDSKKKPAAKSTDSKQPAKKNTKNDAGKKPALKGKVKNDEAESEPEKSPARAGSRRSAALKAASQISKSAEEWMPQNGDSDSDNYQSDAESSSDDDSESEDDRKIKGRDRKYESESDDESVASASSEDSAMAKAVAKQREALERSKKSKKTPLKKKQKEKEEATKSMSKKTKGKGKPKKFDDDHDFDSSDDSDGSFDFGGGNDDIDMDLLIQEAMAGAKNSVLHSLCWWRIILDEAHMIKTRSSQTANAAFSLVGVHRWALSGTPLQNRVGEFYSLVRFLRLDPMAFYYCRLKDCDCKSMHYRIVAGRCEGCGHGGVHHYSHFNKYILNPIQRDGYSGDGRRAMFTLKNEVLDKCLLRRTKETKAADMELPPRLVQIKPVRLHPVEEDFYSALYTQTKSSFNDYVDSGTLLNNYAHIFDLLIRMRQSVDHPYLVIHSNKSSTPGSRSEAEQSRIANGSAVCDLCQEPPTDRVVSTCCGSAYCRSCVLEYMAGMAAAGNMTCPSCRNAFSIDLETRQDVEDDSTLNIEPDRKKGAAGSDIGMPSLKELMHVATGSILRRINLAEFATSSKIEALTQELVMMRQTSPGSKAIVFSQFVNMLDLIRWRLHSDPYLEDIGLGARALHGGMNVKARDQVLKEFREDNNVRVLLMSLKAGGVALNLTCANHIYLMDPWWNPAAEMQAIDRTHRLGQYRPIRAVRFIAENTVEERILQLQEKKRLVFDGTVGRDAGSLKMLTVDDMKSLFA